MDSEDRRLFMMLIHEYRVVMPLTVEEYNVGQLFTTAEMSQCETGGGEGIEIIKSEPFHNHPLLAGRYNKGQYTMKIYHLESKMPTLIKFIMPRGSMKIHEECWNAYPYVKTVLTNPGYMKNDFELVIETLHHHDKGQGENMLNLPPDLLQKRSVTVIDIGNDPISSKDYDQEYDPAFFKSEKTGRGPLKGNWIEEISPIMTCYKLVYANFKWFGLQGRVERMIHNVESRLFTVFHRRMFCSIDKWYGMTVEDIRRLEDEARLALDRLRATDGLRGTSSVGSG